MKTKVMMGMMQTIEEIRREWLMELIGHHKSLANLNIALGRPRTDATLSQIKNQAVDSKSGKPRNMGSPLAREIERRLGLEVGVLDHPPEDKTSGKWSDYKAIDVPTKVLVDYLLEKNKVSPPEWVDSDIRAYLDSIELKIIKWLAQQKNAEEKDRLLRA